MTTRYISEAPPVDMIFTAARYATNAKVKMPLDFNVEGDWFSFNWVNGLTWMGEGSRHLAFTVKLHGYEFRIELDSHHRVGQIMLKNPQIRGPRDIFDVAERERARLRASTSQRSHG